MLQIRAEAKTCFTHKVNIYIYIDMYYKNKLNVYPKWTK